MTDLATRMAHANFASLSEPQPEATKTAIERMPRAELTALQQQWQDDGVIVLRNFMPADMRAAYCAAREQHLPKDRTQKDNFWGGWHFPTPYTVCDELQALALYRPLTDILREVIGEEMGLHLALTGWVSTERNFHQDTYLNPASIWSYYLAVWIALDDIHPDAGPFEFVRGSHKWDVLRQEKLFQHLTPEEQASPAWPSFTQDWVARACEDEITRHGGMIEQFIPQGGDVLVWHSNLVHRGSQPKDPERLRKSLICHYSSVHRRPDMSDLRVHENGSQYFYFPAPGEEMLPPEEPEIEPPKAGFSVRALFQKLLGK